MLQFHLLLKMTNAAFDDEPASELALILRALAQQAEGYWPDMLAKESGPLIDINGNTIGHWRLVQE